LFVEAQRLWISPPGLVPLDEDGFEDSARDAELDFVEGFRYGQNFSLLLIQYKKFRSHITTLSYKTES
jgi:hypothetical protein